MRQLFSKMLIKLWKQLKLHLQRKLKCFKCRWIIWKVYKITALLEAWIKIREDKTIMVVLIIIWWCKMKMQILIWWEMLHREKWEWALAMLECKRMLMECQLRLIQWEMEILWKIAIKWWAKISQDRMMRWMIIKMKITGMMQEMINNNNNNMMMMEIKMILKWSKMQVKMQLIIIIIIITTILE